MELRAGVAKGMPIDKDWVFFGKQGHSVAGTDHGIQAGGPMVDHGELDALAGNADRFQKLGEWLPVRDGFDPFAAQVRAGFVLE